VTWKTLSCVSSKSSSWNWALDFLSSPGKTYPARRGRLLQRTCCSTTANSAPAGSRAEAGQLQARIQSARWSSTSAGWRKTSGNPKRTATRHHPLCRQKYRADRTVGTRCCRYPCGRIFDSSAPQILPAKLHEAIEVARIRIQSREEENIPELPAQDRS